MWSGLPARAGTPSGRPPTSTSASGCLQQRTATSTPQRSCLHVLWCRLRLPLRLPSWRRRRLRSWLRSRVRLRLRLPRRLPEPHRARPWVRPPRLRRQLLRVRPGTHRRRRLPLDRRSRRLRSSRRDRRRVRPVQVEVTNVPRSVAAMRDRRPRRTRRARRPARTLLRLSRARLPATRAQTRTAPRRLPGCRERPAPSPIPNLCDLGPPTCLPAVRRCRSRRMAAAERRRRRKYAAERSTELRASRSVGSIAGPVPPRARSR